jgi:hypothetical protein
MKSMDTHEIKDPDKPRLRDRQGEQIIYKNIAYRCDDEHGNEKVFACYSYHIF